MTFEELQKANETIKTTDVKGKAYAEVNQRIKAFRMLYPDGFIIPNILSLADGIVTMTAKVGYYQDGKEVILGIGTAQEKESSSYINKTSYIENCETSAVGRALGMCGIGIDMSVASAEEIQNAILNQEEKATFDQLATIKANIPSDKVQAYLRKWRVRSFEELTKIKAEEIIRNIENAKTAMIQEEA